MSRSVRVRIVTSRKLVFATSGRPGVDQRRRADPGLRGHERPRLHGDRGHGLPDPKSRVVRDSVVRVYYRPGAPGAAMLDAAADAFDAIERRLGSYPHRTFRVAQSAGGVRDGVARAHLDPDRGRAASNLRYLGDARDGPPVVLRDRRQRPGEGAVRRRGRGRLRGTLRARPPAREPMRQGDARPDDLFVQRHVLLREDLHPGRQPARRRAASGWARPRSGRPCAGT